jgi:hypothetical protein
MSMMTRYGLMILLVAVSTHGFMTDPAQGLVQRRALFFTSTSSSLPMAGFGKGAEKKTIILKPKQQWDRYTGDDLKGSKIVRVGVHVIDDPSSSSEAGAGVIEWMEVGTVKSKDDAYTETAVIRQKALIADHSRRMFPLQIFAKDTLEWGYMQGEEWLVAGKVKSMPDDIEKLIGFQGLPEPTGFYSFNKATTIDNSALDGGFDSLMKKRTNG